MAAYSVSNAAISRCVSRSDQRRLCRPDDEQRHWLDVAYVWSRLGHLLLRLLRLRRAFHRYSAQGGSTFLDRSRDDYVGPRLGSDGLHSRADQLLCPQVPARPRGGGLLSRNHSLPQLLVSFQSSLGRNCNVYGRCAGCRAHRLANLWRAYATQWPARSAWLAVALPRRRPSRVGAGRNHLPFPDRSSC